MQTMTLNAVAAAVKGGTGQAAGDGAAAAAAGGAGASGDSVFGALLAQQIKLDPSAPVQGLPIDLSKSDVKKATDDPAALAVAASADHPVDPNALAGLVAQALTSLNGRSAAPAAATVARDGTALPTKGGVEGLAKGVGGPKLPVVEDAASGKPQSPVEEKAAGIADSGKMLPVEAMKEEVHAHQAKEALPEQFGDKLAAAQQAIVQADPTKAAPVSNVDAQAGRIDRPVGTPGWGGDLGQKVVWMVGQQKQSAELQLNPPQLGPLEVRLTLNQDQMTATFVSHHAAVREAIETALPRLREMLADNGIALGNVMVGAESFAQQQQQQQQQAAAQQSGQGGGQAFMPSLSEADGMVATLPGAVRKGGEGLVNTFV